MFDTDDYRVKPGKKVDLSLIPCRVESGQSDEKIQELQGKLQDRCWKLQEKFYADGRFALLVVFQAMDAGGKDSTISHVFGRLNPQGCRVTSFKGPNATELSHDYLWRIHHEAPAKGMIGIFNRSHYEDVLAVRVKQLAPPEVWKKRYAHINAFEQMLTDEGTVILKFYLHISKAYQKRRLQMRLDDPQKTWKFNPDDLTQREDWGKYRKAFEQALERCSTKQAPWYIVPAENRRFRDLLVTQVVVDALEKLDLRYPKPDFDPKTIRID